jgi:Skp family chaperone for outer membrane proteins
MKKAGWSSILVAALLLTVAAMAEAQQPKKVSRIGYLSLQEPAAESTRFGAIQLALATNMEMTESEAKGFWPIYDQYQKDLQKINQRIANLLESDAADFRGKSLTDERAKKLTEEAVAIEQAEANLKSTYAPKLSKVLPVRKVARYLQIKNKFRAVIKYDLAQGVQLVQ